MNLPAVIVFLKAPEKGRVKTRLCQDLDDGFGLKLYQAFVLDTLCVVAPFNHTFVFFQPPGKDKEIKKWLGPEHTYVAQQGENLGRKMAHAFETVFGMGFNQALLIGTDIPEITTDILAKAVQCLLDKKAVIGPAGDGGYYLIGFEKTGFSNDFFKDITWSGPTVFDQTTSAFNNCLLEYTCLPVLDDIDTVHDLNRLKHRMAAGQTIGTHTAKVLQSL